MKRQIEFQPPTGTSFSPRDWIRAPDLSAALCACLEFLQSENENVSLERIEDWWKHDGLFFLEGTIDFTQAFQLVKSTRSMLEAMPADESVRIGILGGNRSWYLRFRVEWDEDEMRLDGHFGLTVPQSSANSFRTGVAERLPFQLEEENSVDYFARIQA